MSYELIDFNFVVFFFHYVNYTKFNNKIGNFKGCCIHIKRWWFVVCVAVATSTLFIGDITVCQRVQLSVTGLVPKQNYYYTIPVDSGAPQKASHMQNMRQCAGNLYVYILSHLYILHRVKQEGKWYEFKEGFSAAIRNDFTIQHIRNQLETHVPLEQQ